MLAYVINGTKAYLASEVVLNSMCKIWSDGNTIPNYSFQPIKCTAHKKIQICIPSLENSEDPDQLASDEAS